MTRRGVEKLFTKKVCVDFFWPLLSGVNKRGRPSKWPPECLPSKFADFECPFSRLCLGENMTPKDPFLAGTLWDKFWRPIRSRALLFTPDIKSFFQDTFDHDKGQKSAISGRRLHWRLSTGFFAFSPGPLCNLVRRAP